MGSFSHPVVHKPFCKKKQRFASGGFPRAALILSPLCIVHVKSAAS